MTKRPPPSKAATTPNADAGIPLQGSAGLKIFSGILSEERKREVIGETGRETYTSMSHHPIIGAAERVWDSFERGVEWNVEAAGGGQAPEDQALKQFVEDAMSDMGQPWADVVSEAGSARRYGWWVGEWQMKFRRGLQSAPVPYEKLQLRIGVGAGAGLFIPENPPSSRFNDGKVGWHKCATRSQDSLMSPGWAMSTTGDILAMYQRPAPDYQLRTIGFYDNLGLQQVLHCRVMPRRNNPEGLSLYRSIYDTWYDQRRLKALLLVFMERMCGYQILKVPEHWTHQDASPDDKASLAHAVDMVTNVKVHERMGMVIPALYDAQGHEVMSLTTLPIPASGSNLGIGEVIERYDRDIAIGIIAGFMMLGHQRAGTGSVGSNAMADMTDLATAAMEAWLDHIETQLNAADGAVVRLLTLNGLPTSNPPKIRHGSVNLPNWTELAAMLNALVVGGAQIFPSKDHELEKAIINTGFKLPWESDEDQIALQQAMQQQQMQAPQQPPPEPGQQQNTGAEAA